MSKAKAVELGLDWLAEIGAHGVVAGPDSTLQQQPANAIAAACAQERLDPAALDLVEINEAFAAVGIASTRTLGLDPSTVNVNGGAIAIGHPIGMSGARIALHLALELNRRGGGTGAAALCGGGGQGSALILRVPGLAGPARRCSVTGTTYPAHSSVFEGFARAGYVVRACCISPSATSRSGSLWAAAAATLTNPQMG